MAGVVTPEVSAVNTRAYELVMIAVPGVQRFIDEGRSTADVHAASEIVARLSAVGAKACLAVSPEVVPIFPAWPIVPAEALASAGEPGIGLDLAGPNRIVVLAPPEVGQAVVEAAVTAIKAEWRRLVRATFGLPAEDRGEDSEPTPPTPGMPVAVWVKAESSEDGYTGQWARAQAAMAARRRLRDFPAMEARDTELCDLSPRWAAATQPPPGLRPHEQARLAPANWVKRRWRQVRDSGASEEVMGFPSTPSIASAPFRREVLERLDEDVVGRSVWALRDAARQITRVSETPLAGLKPYTRQGGDLARWLVAAAGPWVYADRWQLERLARDTKRASGDIRQAVEHGRRAAVALQEVMRGEYQVRAPTDYLAVIVQDVDGMGLFLGGRRPAADGSRLIPEPQRHRAVSELLARLSTEQAARFGAPDVLGVPVYAGGDDLLGFTPASTALAAARSCRDLIPAELPTASTAVVFFHQSHSLRDALKTARDLLEDAKERVHRKDALGVAFARRSGAAESSVQPWRDRSGANAQERFQVFAADADHPLSPRLLAELQRDQHELAGLHAVSAERFRDELTRLVGRHMAGGDAQQARATARELEALATGEAMRPKDVPGGVPYPAPAARVAVFLRQEAWPYPHRDQTSA